MRLTARAQAVLPESTSGVSFEPLPGCKRPHGPDSSCVQVEAREINGTRVPVYELKLPNRAYGLFFAVASTELVAGKLGAAHLSIWATDETPEGSYGIPLQAEYRGYTPLRCELFERISGSCPKPRVGAQERHSGVAVWLLVVRVLPPDPNRSAETAQLAAEQTAERQRKAAERTAEIESALVALGEIKRKASPRSASGTTHASACSSSASYLLRAMPRRSQARLRAPFQPTSARSAHATISCTTSCKRSSSRCSKRRSPR